MNRILSIITFMAICLSTQAQEIHMGPLHSMDSPRENWLLPGDTIYEEGKTYIYGGKPIEKPQENNYGGLHEGLNASIGVSAFATTGKNVPHKGGFTQNINLTYVSPLSKDGRLWVMAGGYLNNMNWDGDNYRDLGLYATLGYKFNEHWEAYIYGQLSLNNNYDNFYSRYAGWEYGKGYYGMGYYPGVWSPMSNVMPMGYGMGCAGANVLGAGVKYNVNKNFSININVEGAWFNNHTPSYYGKYKYPVPQGATE